MKEDLVPLVQASSNIPYYGRSGSFFSTSENEESSNNNNDDIDGSHNAFRVLTRRPSGVLGSEDAAAAADLQMVRKAKIRWTIFPFYPLYKIFWMVTAIGSIVTIFNVPFQLAFQEDPGKFLSLHSAGSTIEFLLEVIFTIDIIVNFNLSYYSYDQERMVINHKDIFVHYFSNMFWVDLIGVFPFETLAVFLAEVVGSGDAGTDADAKSTLIWGPLRLLRFVRLHRMQKLSYMLQYDARISLLWFTLLRNGLAVVSFTHFEACSMYFLARLRNFDDSTWLGQFVDESITGFDRYITSLYWSIVTFATVGYGDFSPINADEKLLGSIFMLLNIVVAAWIIGSITLLVVKGDEKTGEYRDSLETLHQYGTLHHFDESFMTKLKRQLRLGFHNREIADEQVLQHFPSAVRRKILRRLYREYLVKTQLMDGLRQQFVDAFLASCTVEIFSPGEEIVERGSILSDLFLLVGGIAEITSPDGIAGRVKAKHSEDDFDIDEHLRNPKLEPGDFIGEIGFFTESPQVDSVSCLTVCKTLTITQSAYKLLAQDHPDSVGKILKNLLKKVESLSLELEIPKDLAVLRAGSRFDLEAQSPYGSTVSLTQVESDMSRRQKSLTAIKDLVQMHMGKQLDDQTTRLLFAASRGDTSTISLMVGQGFSPNNADYDNRTALMVASMKGNTDVARLLLEYKADPNRVDMHGTSALYEAVKNGHEATMQLLMSHDAKLCMNEALAASVMCQAVFDGDILLLRRLLEAGIDPNAADYDKRTASHVAAAEGNVAAIKVLAEHNANLSLEDRWKNTVLQEAQRNNARQLMDYLKKTSRK